MASIDLIVDAMSDQPWGVTEEQGRELYQFVLQERPEQILELGCGIGTSACYIAGALEELGQGTITSIDRNPGLPEWVARTFAKVPGDLSKYHQVVIDPASYNNHLLHLIEAQTKDGLCEPCFDFCFIDGAHTWETDGCAFFLAEKLLKPGKWILFDDVFWTVAGSPEAIKNLTQPMSEEFQQMQQVLKVVNLLVAQHPGFEDLRISGDWAWARKRAEVRPSAGRIHYDKPSFAQRAIGKLKRLLAKGESAGVSQGTP